MKTFANGRWLFPYGLEQFDDGKWRLFDREYQTVGSTFQFLQKPTKRQISEMAWDAHPEPRVYFYNSTCLPTPGSKNWNAYIKRLSVFAKLRVAIGE
jgi:hypothetical protein